MQRLAKGIYYAVAIGMALSIVWKSVDYWHPDFGQGFLLDKAGIFYFYRFALYAHIVAAPVAFFSGMVQVCFPRNKFHQTIGSVYVFSILFLAAPSGLFMSFFAIGGVGGTLNFALLSILWGGYTFKAYQATLRNKRQQHVRFIIGSFILTQSAILLRLFSYVNHQADLVPGTDGYLMVSVLSWLPWIVGYEMLGRPGRGAMHGAPTGTPAPLCGHTPPALRGSILWKCRVWFGRRTDRRGT